MPQRKLSRRHVFTSIFPTNAALLTTPQRSISSGTLNTENITAELPVPDVKTLRRARFASPPRRIYLAEYTSGTGTGSGTLYYDPRDKSTPDDGGLIFVTDDGHRYKRRHDSQVPVTSFGAVGDAETDDTDAFQRAVATTCLNGYILTIPTVEKHYRISKSILIPHATTGWTIRGFAWLQTLSTNRSEIRQYSDNTPIFMLQGQHAGCQFSHIAFNYSKRQTSRSPKSIAIAYGGGGWQLSFTHLSFRNCRRGISMHPDYTTGLVWQSSFTFLYLYEDCTGSLVSLAPDIGGQPANLFTNIYVRGDSLEEPALNLKQNSCFWVTTLEANKMIDTPVLVASAGANGAIGTIRVEDSDYSTSGDPLFIFNDAQVEIDLFEIQAVRFASKESLPLPVISTTNGSEARIRINRVVERGCTKDDGDVDIYRTEVTNAGIEIVRFFQQTRTVNPVANHQLSQLNTLVTSWLIPRPHSPRLDLDIHLTMGDPTIQILRGPQERPTTVFLPKRGIFPGAWFTFLLVASTGAYYTIDVGPGLFLIGPNDRNSQSVFVDDLLQWRLE